MIDKVIELILGYVTKMQSVYEDERKVLRLELYRAAEKLYKQEPGAFLRGTYELLTGNVPMLDTESCKIKMECAGIWHKNSFDIWVMRIRFFLNENSRENIGLLKCKLTEAFSCREKDFIKKHDATACYERMLRQVLSSNEPEDQNLRKAVEGILSPDLAKDIDGVITYVSIKQLCKGKKDIPAHMKTVYNGVTGFSVIETNGLAGWLIENKTSGLRGFASALKKLGLISGAQIISDLYQAIKDIKGLVQNDGITDPKITAQIENTEKKLMRAVSIEEIRSKAEEFLGENRNDY